MAACPEVNEVNLGERSRSLRVLRVLKVLNVLRVFPGGCLPGSERSEPRGAESDSYRADSYQPKPKGLRVLRVVNV